MKTFKDLTYQPQPPAETEFLRAAIKEEEDAVRLYSGFMERSEDSRVKELLRHVIEEEEHHIKEFKEMIQIITGV